MSKRTLRQRIVDALDAFKEKPIAPDSVEAVPIPKASIPEENPIRTDWVPTYIERIEGAIRETFVERGLTNEVPENRAFIGAGADMLAGKILDMCNDLQMDLGASGTGDSNINLMLSMLLLSYSWYVFIMTAKGTCPQRYGLDMCAAALAQVRKVERSMSKIHEAATEYAKTYELDNDKWVETLFRAATKKYKKVALDIDEFRAHLQTPCCENRHLEENCYPPFLGTICSECKDTAGVHHTYTKQTFSNNLTRGDFQEWLDKEFNGTQNHGETEE